MNIVIQNWSRNKYIAPYPVPPTATLATLKWMPGDSVAEDGSVLHRTVTKIVGIIDVLNRTRFGTTSRGVPFYIMYPIDVSYPPFLVAMKSKPETNIFAVVKYEHWLPGSPWPRASFIKSLGPVGDMNTEHTAILQTLPPLRPVTAPEPPFVTDAADTWDVVLHIDPPGCQDVDDIVCWKYIDATHVVFGIGIADASYWVPEGGPHDCIAKERGATLYKDGVAIEPMLPVEISAGCASLRCDGNVRPAICLTFDLMLVSGVWRLCGDCHGTWKQSNIVVTESYTYETIYEHTERAEHIRMFLSAVCGTTLGVDSHEWIEHAMILYNRRVAEELHRAGVGILRSHSGMSNEQFAELAVETGCTEIAWLGSAAGQYVAPSENTGHAGLRLALYTHASSPLRRYVDLVNQRWLKALQFGAATPTATPIPAELNAAAKRIRHLERDLHFIGMVCGSELPSADGFLITKRTRPGTETWTAYVPAWKRSIPCTLSGGLTGRAGLRVHIRMFLDTRQADWNRRYIYQGHHPAPT